MLITFTTQAYSNITLFRDVAMRLLKMMGHNPTVPGLIMAEDVPAALRSLMSAIAAVRAPAHTLDNDEDGPDLSLKDRALPLIELLSKASSEEANVVWEWT